MKYVKLKLSGTEVHRQIFISSIKIGERRERQSSKQAQFSQAAGLRECRTPMLYLCKIK